MKYVFTKQTDVMCRFKIFKMERNSINVKYFLVALLDLKTGLLNVCYIIHTYIHIYIYTLSSRDEHRTELLMIQKNSMPFRNIENIQLEIRGKISFAR